MYRGTILLAQIVILIIALRMMFTSADILRKPEGNYDAHARFSARIVFIICFILAAWAAVSLYHSFSSYWAR